MRDAKNALRLQFRVFAPNATLPNATFNLHANPRRMHRPPQTNSAKTYSYSNIHLFRLLVLPSAQRLGTVSSSVTAVCD